MWFYIVLGVYLVVCIGFFAAIQFERIKQGIDFNAFQVLVALGWPVWALWYLYVLVSDWWKRKK